MNTPAFSARTIAIAVGKTVRALQIIFRGIDPATTIVVRGQATAGYRVDQFPLRLRNELESLADRSGFRSAEHLLNAPPKRFRPVDADGKEVPISEIAEHQIAKAHRLRNALALTLRSKDEPDREDQMLAEFRRHYGPASRKTWERKFKRTVLRDAGEERFDNLELYFDEVVARKRERQRQPSIPRSPEENLLLHRFTDVSDPNNPTSLERRLIWEACCLALAARNRVGAASAVRQTRARLIEHLEKSGVKFPGNRDSLKRTLRRKYSAWLSAGRSIAALEDRREKRFARGGWRRAAEPTTDDLNLLKRFALVERGRRLDQAWQDVYPHLSEPIRAYYDNGRQMPKRIRDLVRPDVERMKFIKQGERSHKLNGAHIVRSWRDVHAGEWMQGDDVTLPVYFYVEEENGRFTLMRGQLLLMIDEKSDYILGFVLLPKRSYSAIDIRSLITRVCSEHGLPLRGFKFELNVWRAQILTGKNREQFDFPQIIEAGLSRFNLKVERTLLPRGKVIERTIGKLQDRMEGWPGYCGRDERLDVQERFKQLKLNIEAGRLDPRGSLFSRDQITAKIGGLIEEYNHKTQIKSGRLGGRSPHDEWLRGNMRLGEPRTKFDRRLHYFIASEIKEPKVGRNGISFIVGSQTFRYLGEGLRQDGSKITTGELQGERVFAWFNSEDPHYLPCTRDLSGSGLFLLERSYDVPAHDAPGHLLARELRSIDAHQSYARNCFYIVRNTLLPLAFRENVVSPSAIDLGEHIESGRKLISARRRTAEQLDRRRSRVAQRTGIPVNAIARTEDALDCAAAFGDDFERLKSEAETEEKT
jgi:hypothetical protein